MAEAIEKRRKQLGLSPGDFAELTGLTRQGLIPVRAGHRREYQEKTLQGVAAALRWRWDWYERLEKGQQPVEERRLPADPDNVLDPRIISSLSEESRKTIENIIKADPAYRRLRDR